MKNIVLISGLFVISSVSMISNASNSKVISFTTAKNKMYNLVFDNSGKTLYCGCDWSARKTNLNSCNLQSFFPKKQRKRSLRTEAEHIIPASWYLKVNNKIRQCAVDSKQHKESAREYCQEHDIEYKQAHNDLVNLFPAVGQINSDRSNKPFVESVNNKIKNYGSCDISIGSRGIIPPTDKKGDIARIAFYMGSRYQITYSKRQVELFNKWNLQDPISAEEKAHNKRVIEVQGFGIHQ